MADPRALIERLTAAQNAHDVDRMLACFHDDYRSEQPLFPRPDVPGKRDDRVAWGRLYVDDVDRDGADIDAVVRGMAGTGEH